MSGPDAMEPNGGPAIVLRTRLATLAPIRVWRDAAAFAAVLLTYLTTVGGLFKLAPSPQAAVVSAVLAGTIASSPAGAAIAAGAGVGAGAIIGPANIWVAQYASDARILAAAGWAILAASGAWLVAEGVRRRAVKPKPLVWLLVSVVVANMWVTTLTVVNTRAVLPDGTEVPSLYDELNGRASLETQSDYYIYLQIYDRMRRGEGFYEAWDAEFAEHRGSPSGIMNVHMPTLFRVWRALPMQPESLVYAYLLLTSAAVAAVFFALRSVVKPPFALPGCTAVASYLGLFGLQLAIMSQEAWSAALVVLGTAAYVLAASSTRRWRAWTIAAVGFVTSAVLVREPSVLVLGAGAASSLFAPRPRRRFAAISWLVGCGVFVAAYLAHYMRAQPILTHGAEWMDFFEASPLETVVRSLTFGSAMLGNRTWLVLILVVLGAAGASVVEGRHVRAFAGLTTLLSIAAFLFVQNGASDVLTGERLNNWGYVILAVLYCLLPAVFGYLPGLADGRSGTDPRLAERAAI